MSWQKCPICNGSGQDLNAQMSSSIPICPVCKGEKIINEQTGKPTLVRFEGRPNELFVECKDYDQSQKRIQHLEAENILNLATIAKLSEENARTNWKLGFAISVLEYYAENNSWDHREHHDVRDLIDDSDMEGPKLIFGDHITIGGKRARAALAKLKANEPVEEGENV